MPRKRKPALDAQALHPSRVVDLGRVRDDPYGRTWAELILPGIPPHQTAEVAHAIALAVMHVLKWPDDQAAIFAERVRADIADKLHMATTPGEFSVTQAEMPADSDLEEQVPF